MTNENDTYRDHPFKVEAVEAAGPNGPVFVGRYLLMPKFPIGDGAASLPPITGDTDISHPSLDPIWATETEALNHATQAAHHAIELMIEGRTQGQGNASAASARRLAGEQ